MLTEGEDRAKTRTTFGVVLSLMSLLCSRCFARSRAPESRAFGWPHVCCLNLRLEAVPVPELISRAMYVNSGGKAGRVLGAFTPKRHFETYFDIHRPLDN